MVAVVLVSDWVRQIKQAKLALGRNIIYTVNRKKHTKMFCHIFYKTQSILIKFGTHCPEQICDTVV